MKAIGVEVRESLLPNAGKGLFATRNFDVGELVCEYTGKVLTFMEMQRKLDHTYMMGGFGLNVMSVIGIVCENFVVQGAFGCPRLPRIYGSLSE